MSTPTDKNEDKDRPETGGTCGDFVPDRKQTPDADDDAERVAEDNRNKGFDTTHIHSGTTKR